MNKKPVILCDLGGVLIELNWLKHVKALFGCDLGLEELRQKWFSIEASRHFESGKIDFSEFYKSFTKETGTNMTFESFEQEFKSIIGSLKPDCIEFLEKLRKLGYLAMLSNTNDIHVRMLHDSGIFEPFESLFLSHKMGLVKPDKEIYLEVSRLLNRKPEEIYFFDDSVINIEAAQAIGFRATRVDCPQQIYKVMLSKLD